MSRADSRIGPRIPVRWTALCRIAVLAAAGLSACESEPPPSETGTEGERIVLAPTTFEALPGWAEDRHAEAIPALLRSCDAILRAPPDRPLGPSPVGGTMRDFVPICTAAAALPAGDDVAARDFFASWFQPFLVAGSNKRDGLFTGYFEIEVRGATKPDVAYNVPVYRKPDDHVTVDLGDFDPSLAGRSVVGRVDGDRLRPYFERGDIQAGILNGRGLELVWLDDPLDTFMLHVQGSGRVTLPDGRTTRIGYDAHNGHPYRSIGSELITRGELDRHKASWPNIRAWMEHNPSKAKKLLAANPRYIFFREIPGDGPIGAQGAVLTPGRSLAVDISFIPLGAPLWLDTTWPGEEERPLRRVMIAQDTGSAIKGPVRGDFFWGTGDAALAFAGRMKQRGRYYLLLPNGAAGRMAGS